MKLLAVSLMVFPVLAAPPRWSVGNSEHFQIYSTAGERKVRETARYFEQIHYFFAQAMKITPRADRPIRIIQFNTTKEFERFRDKEFAAAYFLATSGVDMIVLGPAYEQALPIAVHEFTHLLVKELDQKTPLWLNEGLAELFSTFKPVGDKVEIGHPILSRYQVLQREKWIGLAPMLEADTQSPYYSDKKLVPVFYSESWALTHMLNLSEKYGLKFGDLLKALAEGKSSAEAMMLAYGKSPLQVQKDLEEYMEGTRFRYSIFPLKVPKSVDGIEVRPAQPEESDLVLAKLLVSLRRPDEAEVYLGGLAGNSPAAAELRAEIAWRAGNMQQAGEHWLKAVEAGSRDPEIYRLCARMLQDPQREAELWRKKLEWSPEDKDARLELGEALFRARRYADAAIALEALAKVTPKQAERLFPILTYSYLELKMMEKAKANLAQALKYSKEDRMRSQLERVATFLSEHPEHTPVVVSGPVQASTPASASAQAGEMAPHMERPSARQEMAVSEPVGPVYSRLTGQLQHVECLGARAKILVSVNGKAIGLLIEDPTTVQIIGNASGPLDLQCGAQKPRTLHVDFEPMEKSSTGAVGKVRRIEVP